MAIVASVLRSRDKMKNKTKEKNTYLNKVSRVCLVVTSKMEDGHLQTWYVEVC